MWRPEPSRGRRPPQGRHQPAGADRDVHCTAALKVRFGGRRSGQLLGAHQAKFRVGAAPRDGAGKKWGAGAAHQRVRGACLLYF